MPDQSDRVLALRENAEPGEIPYVSKSRVKKWLTCQEQFNFAYLKGYKEPGNIYTRRGTNVHEVFEDYYERAAEYVVDTGEYPTTAEMVDFLGDPTEWADYLIPYMMNFLAFEARRVRDSPDPETWLPVAIETEGWLEDPLNRGDEGIPLMGYADAIYDVACFPEVPVSEGVVIVDFKTGKVPNEKYRDEGIYLEGQFYALLFEDEYDIAAVAGYYPKADEFIVSPLKERREQLIYDVVLAMHEVSGDPPGHLPISEQPLCYWGEDGQCAYYDICSSRWGEPLKHADRTREMVAAGASDGAIADRLDCSINHVRYAKKKLGL